MTDASLQDAEAERWHHLPEHGVPLNPLFDWPPRPRAVLAWYREAWLPITGLTMSLIWAVVMWWALIPPLDAMRSFAPGWMLQVWLANTIPQVFTAGGLHWWLYTRKGQGEHTRFDRRDPTRKSGTYTFGNQVWDNVWWTLGSAITVATVFQWVIFWAMSNGFVWTVTFGENPVWFVAWMILIPTWSGFHYYWVHRLEHSPRLYARMHAVHHRNVTTGPWTGISNHWFENLLYFSSYFIHLIVASHPLHVVFHAMFQQVSPVLSHAGFEKLAVSGKDQAPVGDFFHQLHHRYFECNYGTTEIPFDRWFGTYHDGSAGGTARTRAHKRQMYTK